MGEVNSTQGVAGGQMEFVFVDQKTPYRKSGTRLIDLKGRRFGRLVVTGRAEDRRTKLRNVIRWVCECDCGRTIEARGNNLRGGNTTSCGCDRIRRVVDLVGQRFGRLLVLRLAAPKQSGSKFVTSWECRCDCGVIKDVIASCLKSGMTKSCGCVRVDLGRASLIDLTGQRFGKVQVVSRAATRTTRGGQPRTYWLCRCDCGTEKDIASSALRHDLSKSCGCVAWDVIRKHGESRGKSPEYRTWHGMKQRCSDPKQRAWPDYGGRGITVCVRWRESYEAFLSDMGRRPTEKHTVDRIDNDGGYWCGKEECQECGPISRRPNCRWATRKEQAANRRKRARIEQFTNDEMAVVLKKRGFAIVPI